MLIQQAWLYEKAVNFLLELIASDKLTEFSQGDIKELIQSMQEDIDEELESWKQSDVPCDLAEKLRCVQPLSECKNGNCPFNAFAEESHAVFFTKLERLIKRILKKYGRGFENDEKKLTGRERMELLRQDWHKLKEAEEKRLAVNFAKEKVEKALDQVFFSLNKRKLAKWTIKARKRKADGKVILNVSLDQLFINLWPASIVDMLAKLRKKMRTSEDLVEKILECGQAMRLELELQRKAVKKRRQARRKARRKAQRVKK